MFLEVLSRFLVIELNEINKMSTIYRSPCCGIKHIDGIVNDNNPMVTLMTVGIEFFGMDNEDFEEDEDNNQDCAFLIFSEPDDGGYYNGSRLKRKIESENLGKVTAFKPRMNPNSGNMLKMWVWAVNINNYLSFVKRNGKPLTGD